MSYGENSKKSTMKYIKDKQQEIKVRYKKDEYLLEILPTIKKSGLPVATYIKLAIKEKIAADKSKQEELERILEAVKMATVKEIPAIFDDDCRQIILYGSCARGDYTADSDVDIAILTDSDREQAKKYSSQVDYVATKIGIDTTAVVNYVCLPYKEYQEKKDWYPFFKNIEKDGVVLYEH